MADRCAAELDFFNAVIGPAQGCVAVETSP